MSLAPMVSRIRSKLRSGSGAARAASAARQLARTCAGTVVGQVPAAGALARARDSNKPLIDCRARAGERQEGHGDLRVLDRERERGAQLIAVERAMARALIQPAPRRHSAPPLRRRTSAVGSHARSPRSRRGSGGNIRCRRRRRRGGSRSRHRRARSGDPDCLRRRRSNCRGRRSADRARGFRRWRAAAGAIGTRHIDGREGGDAVARRAASPPRRTAR